MTAIRTLSVSALLFSFFSCGHATKNEKATHNTISKVTVAFSGNGCESDCPFEAFSAEKELKASYYGGPSSRRYGYFKGQISQPAWDSIQSRFAKFLDHGIDTSKYSKTDHPDVEFYITNASGKKYFKENTGNMTEKDLSTLLWFISLGSDTNMLKSCDSLPFETTLQYTTR